MQTISFENHTPVMSMQLKTENQYLPRRRDGNKCRAILAAVQEWESSLPGRAQDHVAQLVAEQWEKQNGRGISVNKQNLYRYLKNEGGSEKYTSYVIQLSAAIADAMPILFIGLFNFANDMGCLERSPKRLKMQIFPADALDCEPLIQELITHGLLTEYSVNDVCYLQIKGFLKHQKINRPSASKIPLPPEFTEAKAGKEEKRAPNQGVLHEDSVNPHGGLTDGKGMEGKGKGSNPTLYAHKGNVFQEPQYLQGLDIPIGKFTMHDLWLPSQDWPRLAATWGIALPEPAYLPTELAEFTAYWKSEGNHPALVECCEFLNISLDSEDAARLVKGLGYVVEYRELRACDYGAPTIRKRFFMVMRRDGQPIVWPAATHGDPKSPAVISGKLAPWRTAAECIDWSIPAPSIFGRKKPLAENTLRRIARGIQRFVIESASPFIVKCNHTTTKGKYDCFRGQALSEPLQTITKTHGYAIAVPHLTKFRTGAIGQPVTEPVPTVTAGTSRRPGGNGHALGVVEAAITPFLAGNGGSEYQAKPRPLDKPAHTILKESRACVVAPVIARQFGASIGHRADVPNATITAGGGGKSQLVTPTLIQMGYGERLGQEPRVLQLGNPLGTVTAGGNKFATVSAFLAKHYGGNYTGAGVSLDEPAHSVTTVDHHAVVASHLVKLRGTCRDGQRTDAPMPTITAGGQHVGEAETTLAVEDYDEERAQQVLSA
ncbi:DnaT-like ssDNA-binding domain-containing protein [Klebsiella aerogenes]|uniref:DnaT-like ssDNA-binding domain-containing protein n=1 Tax=Klebsiella aerogenes TaxID=548 RepID=UPI0037514B03